MSQGILRFALLGCVVMTGASGTSARDPSPVQAYLQEALKPATVEVLDGDRVAITADFRRKNLEFAKLFDQKAGRKHDQSFEFRGGDFGIRLSNDGAAFLNCWFTDDVTCEIKYRQSNRSFLDKQIVAVAFRNAQGDYLGNNAGTQLVRSESGKMLTQGKTMPIPAKTSETFKFVMKDGTFAIYRRDEQEQATSYPRKAFASGQVGFIWDGGASGNIMSISITGKLDVKKLHEEMQRAAADAGHQGQGKGAEREASAKKKP